MTPQTIHIYQITPKANFSSVLLKVHKILVPKKPYILNKAYGFIKLKLWLE